MAEASSDGSAEPTFVISRLFAAPRDDVWRAWTEPARIAAWLAPKGAKSHVAVHDLRPEGTLLSWMDLPDGCKMWGKHVYREVAEPSRLVWLHSFSDETGAITRHPFSATWPLTLLTTVTLEAEGSATRVTLTWVPFEASDTERQTFADSLQGMEVGWGGSFDQLADYLAGDR